jgi:molybdopterin-biosynthesis enzyme MoeA-like protein
MALLGRPVTPAVLAMGMFPAGSRIIPNPVNDIPGFSFADHHFLPGFPEMAWPMIEWVLDTRYADSFNARPEAEAALIVWEGVEGLLVDLMEDIERDYPGLIVFSLPALGNAQVRRHLELGVRGGPAQVPPAMAQIETELAHRGLIFERKT